MAFLRPLGVCALLLSASHAALAGGSKQTPTLQAPLQSEGLYMEEATFGDIIGLQPGFEQVTRGKPLSITPQKASIAAKPAPAKLIKAAISAPNQSAIPAPKQFVPDVAPIETLDVPTIVLEPLERSMALLTKADKADIRARQKQKALLRKRILADVKAADRIDVAATPRDISAFKALVDAANAPDPVIAVTQITDDTVRLTLREEQDRLFAAFDGLPKTIEALTMKPQGVSLAAPASLSPRTVALNIAPIKLPPEEWKTIDVAAIERPASLFAPEEYAAVNAEIRAELEAFDIALTPRELIDTVYDPTLVAEAQGAPLTDGLTKSESLAVIDMVGLPGDARLLDVSNEERATLVASVKTTSTEYEAQPVGMGGLETLRDAVEHAVATNPDVKIAEAQQEDAYYAINEARAGFLPKVDLNAGAGPEVSRQSGNEEIVRLRREVNATLRQTVFDFGLTRYDYLRAKQGYESAKLETLQSVEELVYDVSVAYLGVLQQQKVVALAHQNLEAHEGILDLVTAQKEAGQGTAADVNRVSSSLANARSFMLEEESKLQQARDQYRRLLNAPPGLLIDPLIDLSLLPQSAEEAAQRIENESPQLLQVKADAKSIENQLRSQRGNYLPKVEVEVQGNLNTDLAGETGQTRDARAMMYLRYNVYNGGADVATAARLRARVKEIGYLFEKQRREVEQDIRNDFTAIDASRAKVSTIRDQVASAKEVVRLYEEQFRAGDRTAFDLLDAQQALISAKLEQVLNIYQENRAAFRVMQQLGTLYYALTSDD